MSDNQKRALGAIVRSLLLIVFGSLTQHKLVDGPVLGVALDDLTVQIVGWIGSLSVIGWSLLQKWLISHKIQVALAMPPESTETQLNTVIKTTSPGLIPTGPIPSPAEAAAIVNVIPPEIPKP